MENINLKKLCVIQKQVLKKEPNDRFDFIKTKIRLYESDALGKEKVENDNYKS
jgi:hypothetical protein